MSTAAIDRVVAAIEPAADEAVAFTRDLIRIPTVNPPGEEYEDCARFIGDRLARLRLRRRVPRRRRPARAHRAPSAHQRRRHAARAARAAAACTSTATSTSCRPATAGRVDPFGGVVRDGRIYGRGVVRHEGGHRRGGVRRRSDPPRRRRRCTGTIEISGTVDEESGGFAGVAWLAEHGRISAEPDRLRHHSGAALRRSDLHRPSRRLLVRGDRRAAASRTAACRFSASARSITWACCSIGCATSCCRRWRRARTAVPVVPPGARHATINVNGIDGGQPVDGIQTPCVADRCRAVFDRRFLIEEGFDATQAEIVDAARRASPRTCRSFATTLRDLMVVHPTRTPDDSPVIARARSRAAPRARPKRRSSSPARAPTITSTSRGSPACRTASPTARASSISRISPTSTAASTIWSTRPR